MKLIGLILAAIITVLLFIFLSYFTIVARHLERFDNACYQIWAFIIITFLTGVSILIGNMFYKWFVNNLK